MRKYPLFVKGMSLFLVFSILGELLYPTYANALTSGPGTPEFSSFEPVSTTNLVDPFSGNFTYNLPVLNIPGADGGGYAMSLSYHSGVTSEEEASWVGYGWTMNAGAINRSKIGYPDEFNGVSVKKYNKMVPNWTVSAVENINLEIYSNDTDQESSNNEAMEQAAEDNKMPDFIAQGGSGFSFGYSQSLRYNNYTGLMKSYGFSTGYKGMASLNMNFSGGNSTFGFSVNPSAIATSIVRKKKQKLAKEKVGANCDREAEISKQETKLNRISRIFGGESGAKNAAEGKKFYSSNSISLSLSPNPSLHYPGLSVSQSYGKSWNFSGSLGVGVLATVGIELGYSGNANVMINRDEHEVFASGYMNTPNWDGMDPDLENSNIVTDHFIEGETTFSKTDKQLGIPFAGADGFSVTGEGIAGGFRVHHDVIGHFYPTKVTNKEIIQNIGVEVGVGQTIQVGMDVGAGFHRTTVDNWVEGKRADLGQDVFDYEQSNPFFQFSNDPGRETRYTNLGQATSMKLLSGKKLDDSDFNPYLPNIDPYQTSSSSFSEGGSSYIEYTLNSNYGASGFDKMQESIDQNFGSGDHIREVRITKPDGSKYIYGVPVMAQEEKSLTIGLVNGTEDQFLTDFSPGTADINPHIVMNNHIYTEDLLKNRVVIGEHVREPYSTGHLLTQIVTPDYVDVNGNGPDALDYGGWTKFTYDKRYRVNGEMYNHRAPYRGVYYNKGRLSNRHDQMGQFSSGEKEIPYLQTIETKTHIACFVLNNSDSDKFDAVADDLGLTGADKTAFLSYLEGVAAERKDGRGAAEGYDANGKDLASQGNAGSDELNHLEKIVLFSKERLTTPLSTTYFDYTYELCQGVPNNVSYSVDPSTSGKLTLKKVWTETEGLAKARIAPYKFDYNYPKSTDLDPAVMAKYGNLYTEYDGLTDNDQNPDYNDGYLDAWGNYQLYDISFGQRNKLRTWNYQGDLDEYDGNPLPSFDPAAWNLKKITLPSGGEIHIQYEQKDYTHVQNEYATTMVSLTDGVGEANGYKYDENRYYINMEDVGVDDTNPTEVKAYFLKLAQQYFSGVSSSQIAYNTMEIFDGDDNKYKSKMMYFKFLYDFTGSNPSLTNYESSAYVEGYCPVNKIGMTDANSIYFELGGKSSAQKHLTPRRIAYEQGISMGNWAMDRDNDISTAVDIDFTVAGKAYGATGTHTSDHNDELKDIKKYLLKKPNGSNPDRQNLRTQIAEGVLGVSKKSKGQWGNYYNKNLSYFKLVVPVAKRGGGTRVKRLMMYNPGIEGGEASLYGSEYIYKTKSGVTSGVATNEPSGARIENPMVDILPKYKQGTINKLLAGKDKKWSEGPLGEHLLPGASVGHSRVVIKNIHSGKSSAGFVINEYITCKDSPTVTVTQTNLKDKGDDWKYYKKSKFSLPLGMFNYVQDKAWVAQGYQFIINDRHGLMESSYTYNGNYEDYVNNPSQATVYSSVENEYSSGAENVIQGEIDASGELKLSRVKYSPGYEEDIAMFAGRVEDRTFDFSIELDINFWIQWPPLFSFGFGATVGYQETELSQHITSRVVRQTSKIRKTTAYADGIRTTTENLAYNNLDGSVLISKVSTAYDSPETGNNREYYTAGNTDNVYYSMNMPAPWVYGAMGKKSVDPNNFNLLTASMGSISTHMSDPLAQFAGDNTWYPYTEPIEGLVSASAVEYRKGRFEDVINDFASGTPIVTNMDIIKQEFGVDAIGAPELAQMNTFYYPVASYAFIGDRTSANEDPDNRVYNAGTLESFEFFRWGQNGVGQSGLGDNIDLSALNPKWKSPSFVSKFSPNGQPLEEVNALGIHSAARMGYGNLLPTISGLNAEYESILFDDFEYEDGFGTTNSEAHTGNKSLLFGSTISGTLSNQSLKLTQQLIDKGGRFKVWVRLTDPVSSDPLLTEVMDENPQLNIGGNLYPLKKIAKVGEWTLLRVDVSDWGAMSLGDSFVLKLQTDNLGTKELLIDDVCFHPLEAGVTMSVYDAHDFRVMAQMGDQHFATIYEYNSEGQLVRTVIETEKGRKTVKEQQINSPKEEK